MRRFLLLVLLSAGLTVPAACGDETPFAFPTVSSPQVGVDPTIVAASPPPKETVIQVLSEGAGRPVHRSDVLVTNVKSQVWKPRGAEATPYVNTFADGEVLIRSLNQIVPGWAKVLPGVKVGSRVLVITPPEDGFGAEGNEMVGVTKDDPLIFVIDILDAIAPDARASGKPIEVVASPKLPAVTDGAAPVITVPEIDPPKGLVERVLLEGSGPKVVEGQQVAAQYTGVIWSSGTEFDTSWKEGRGPFGARLAGVDPRTGVSGVIPGWVMGLVGQRVGSRILLVIPPELGYGSAGNPAAGISGTDTLVFVIDILAAYDAGTGPTEN